MYSPIIIAKNMEEFAAREGWMPIRHTMAEVEEFKATINKLIKIESNSKNAYATLTRAISSRHVAEIRRFVENEQVMCGLDAGYWENRYAHVIDEGGHIRKFKNRRSQEVFDSVIAGFDEQQMAIQIICLKARQVGLSTKVALKFLHRMLFMPNILAVMASVQKEKSDLIERMLNTAYSECPWWLVPHRTPKKGFSNGSILSVQSGMQPKGIAQGATPTCLVPTTRIRTSNGLYRNICSFSEGDEILTHAGNIARVKKAFKTRPDGDITKIIKTWGNYQTLESTLEHLILTDKGWVEACELSVGDYVVHPVREIAHRITSISVNHFANGMQKPELLTLETDFHLGYLAGFYLAEGCVHNAKNVSETVFAVHERELEDRHRSLQNVLGDRWTMTKKPHQNHGAVIKVYCSWLARWLSEEFGRTKNKRIPDWVFEAGKEFCTGLIKGFFDGDGHCAKAPGNLVKLPTVIQSLAYQMRDLIASVGFGWSSIYFRRAHVYKGMLKQDVWWVVLSGITGASFRKEFGKDVRKPKSNPRHWRYSSDKKHIEIMIESIANGWCDSFWDLEIDHEDHSFTTEICSVHNCIHISELGLIPDPKNVIEEGLLPATHASRNLFMVFESTGSGNVGWFPDFWRDSKKNFPLGLARMCPVFIPWPMATDLYPQEDWLRTTPIPLGFYERRLDATKAHVARCESYIRNTPYLAKVAGSDYRMPLEQQWFWEFEYRQAKERHSLQQFAARMPADDFEALTGVHDSVFDPEVIGDLKENIYEVQNGREVRKKPVQAYAIIGHSIDYKFDPDPNIVDENKPIIDITWTNNRNERYDWQMVPLLPINEDVETETFDKLLVYEEPQRGAEYAFGVDTAHGLGKPDEDRMCGSMNKKAMGAGFDQQVAEITSNRMSPSQTVPFLACIAAWYGQKSKDWRGVKFVIEQVEGPGDTCQNQLKIMGFNYHHQPGRYDGKKIKDVNKHREGWYSNRVSVPILMDRFIEAINGGWYKPMSKWLIEECITLERHIVDGGKDKMIHRQGQHDDRVRAAAQSYFSLHDLDDLADRSQKRYAMPSKKKTNTVKTNAGMISVGDW